MNKLDVKIETLLKREGFDNDQLYYADYETFEEIPLFSRWRDIRFLKNYSTDDNNKLLISHAISLAEHAAAVACDELGRDYADYFCCVTLTKWDCIDEINCVTPNLYISRRKNWLFSYIKLRKTHSKKELIVTGYIKELGFFDYDVYVSNLVGDYISRVYIVKKIYFP